MGLSPVMSARVRRGGYRGELPTRAAKCSDQLMRSTVCHHLVRGVHRFGGVAVRIDGTLGLLTQVVLRMLLHEVLLETCARCSASLLLHLAALLHLLFSRLDVHILTWMTLVQVLVVLK